MHVTNEKANHSIENSSAVSSIYDNIQDFYMNKTLQEVSQEAVPVSLNATFQRPPYPDPIPATFVTAIISYCPPDTSTCFGCRKSLREFGDLCFIIKLRCPISRMKLALSYIPKNWKMCTFTCQKFVSDRFSRIFWPATHHCTRLIVICYCKSKLTYEQVLL